MVRSVLAVLVGLLAVCLLVFCACRSNVDFPPALEPGAVPDTALVVKTIPGSGYVNISKNGYRVFNLDSIVTDDDDEDSDISWSLSPGPLLNVNLKDSLAEIGPLPNQAGESYVVFTATDPLGLSVSKTCPILVFDEFRVDTLLGTIAIKPDSTKRVAVAYGYRDGLEPGLEWEEPQIDTAWLKTCSLSVKPDSLVLTVEARDSSGTTGIYLAVDDPVNHVTFHHSIPVAIQQ